MAGALGIEPRLTESKSVVLPLHNAPTIKQDSIFWLFFKKRFLMFAVAILNLVPRTRIELVITTYQEAVIPFNYPGIFGGLWGNRTPVSG